VVVGVSKHRSECNSLEFGGHDGGFECSFVGDFDPDQFSLHKESLGKARDLAGENPSLTENCVLGGHVVSVDASGARAGMHYRFKFKFCGVTFFVHHKCPKGRQAVRVRYGASALIGRSLYDVHGAVLRFLSDIGFTVVKETVSRVDMQVTVGIPIPLPVGNSVGF
jgi:hypothetical protein